MDAAFPIWNDCAVLDLIQLRVFGRIADTGSLSATARLLGMPKSSVSRALARLEEATGQALIERSTRALRLTDAGLLLRRHAARILDDVGEAENALGGLIGHPSGTLRVSVGFTFAAGPLAPMLPGFLARYPDVRLVLSVDNRPTDLLAEEVDVAIRIGPLRDSELIARKLGTMALWPCASPAYLAARSTPRTVADLAGHTLISHGERRSAWRLRAPDGTVEEVEAGLGAVIPEPAVLGPMLVGGAGIGWLPDFLAESLLAAGTLVRVLPDHEGEALDVHALYPSHRSLSAKVRAFVDALAARMDTRLSARRHAGTPT